MKMFVSLLEFLFHGNSRKFKPLLSSCDMLRAKIKIRCRSQRCRTKMSHEAELPQLVLASCPQRGVLEVIHTEAVFDVAETMSPSNGTAL